MKTKLLRKLRKEAQQKYKAAFWDGWWYCFEKVDSTWKPLLVEYMLPIRCHYNAYCIKTEAEALKTIDIYRRQYILSRVRPSIHRRNRLRLQKKLNELKQEMK